MIKSVYLHQALLAHPNVCGQSQGLNLQHLMGHNKLECYITLGWKGLPVANTLAYSAHSYITQNCYEYDPRSLP